MAIEFLDKTPIFDNLSAFYNDPPVVQSQSPSIDSSYPLLSFKNRTKPAGKVVLATLWPRCALYRRGLGRSSKWPSQARPSTIDQVSLSEMALELESPIQQDPTESRQQEALKRYPRCPTSMKCQSAVVVIQYFHKALPLRTGWWPPCWEKNHLAQQPVGQNYLSQLADVGCAPAHVTALGSWRGSCARAFRSNLRGYSAIPYTSTRIT